MNILLKSALRLHFRAHLHLKVQGHMYLLHQRYRIVSELAWWMLTQCTMQVPVGVVPGLGSAMMPGVADQYAQQVRCNGKHHQLP